MSTAQPIQMKKEDYDLYTECRDKCTELTKEMNNLQYSIEENKDVVKTLSTMDGDRRCLHSVNNVMEDKTVKEVLVDLENERKEMMERMGSINTEIREKEKIAKNIEVKYGLTKPIAK